MVVSLYKPRHRADVPTVVGLLCTACPCDDCSPVVIVDCDAACECEDCSTVEPVWSNEQIVSRLPMCDMHALVGLDIAASYDCLIVNSPAMRTYEFGTWAYMCVDCFKAHGPGRVESEIAQRLVIESVA